MDDVTIRDGAGAVLAELTTEHAASSYGRPVLVYEGEAFGPDDVLEQPGDAGPLRAGAWVRAWAADPARTESEQRAATLFCGQ